jgi:hypothetical protein
VVIGTAMFPGRDRRRAVIGEEETARDLSGLVVPQCGVA